MRGNPAFYNLVHLLHEGRCSPEPPRIPLPSPTPKLHFRTNPGTPCPTHNRLQIILQVHPQDMRMRYAHSLLNLRTFTPWLIRVPSVSCFLPNEPHRLVIYTLFCMWVVWAVALQPTPKTVFTHPCVRPSICRPCPYVYPCTKGISLCCIHLCLSHFSTHRSSLLCRTSVSQHPPVVQPSPAHRVARAHLCARARPCTHLVRCPNAFTPGGLTSSST